MERGGDCHNHHSQSNTMGNMTKSSYASAAIALNNIGVSLLERGCYQSATKTLQDALSVLRFGFKKEDGTEEAAVALKLHKAMQRLSNRQFHTTSQGRQQPIWIRTISSSDLSHAASMVFDGGFANGEAYTIRIDDVDMDTMSNDSPDAECAMILHNFALSYLCMSRVVTSLRCKRLRDGALKLCSAAQTILNNGRERATCPSQRDFLMHIEVFVVSFFVQIHPGSRKHYDRLIELKTLVESQGHELLYGSSNERAAAAA